MFQVWLSYWKDLGAMAGNEWAPVTWLTALFKFEVLTEFTGLIICILRRERMGFTSFESFADQYMASLYLGFWKNRLSLGGCCFKANFCCMLRTPGMTDPVVGQLVCTNDMKVLGLLCSKVGGTIVSRNCGRIAIEKFVGSWCVSEALWPKLGWEVPWHHTEVGTDPRMHF